MSIKYTLSRRNIKNRSPENILFSHIDLITNHNYSLLITNYCVISNYNEGTEMKLGLQVFSWIAVVLGVLAVIGGLTSLNVDPSGAYYSLLGGVLFTVEGVLALIYVNQATKLNAAL